MTPLAGASRRVCDLAPRRGWSDEALAASIRFHGVDILSIYPDTPRVTGSRSSPPNLHRCR